MGLLRNGDGPTVMLRADMDALTVKEETGLPYASSVTSSGGPAPVRAYIDELLPDVLEGRMQPGRERETIKVMVTL